MFFHLKKLESPSPKDAMCQDWLKLAQWFWRGEFFYFVNVFLLFCNYLPLEKGGVLHLNKLESPSPKDALWLVEIGPVVLEKKIYKFCQCIFAIWFVKNYIMLKRNWGTWMIFYFQIEECMQISLHLIFCIHYKCFFQTLNNIHLIVKNSLIENIDLLDLLYFISYEVFCILCLFFLVWYRQRQIQQPHKCPITCIHVLSSHIYCHWFSVNTTNKAI